MKCRASTLFFMLIMILGMLCGCGYNTDYGQKLPPELPPSVPIVQGDIVESRRTTFEVDKGYVVGIRSKLGFEETIRFYQDALARNGYTAEFKEAIPAPGSSEKMMTFEARLGTLVILGEIVSKPDSAYVNLAVHLGK